MTPQSERTAHQDSNVAHRQIAEQLPPGKACSARSSTETHPGEVEAPMLPQMI